MRRKFFVIAKFKHFYLVPGTMKENAYQVEPVLLYVKNSLDLLKH
jgi:hypothetical protein